MKSTTTADAIPKSRLKHLKLEGSDYIMVFGVGAAIILGASRRTLGTDVGGKDGLHGIGKSPSRIVPSISTFFLQFQKQHPEHQQPPIRNRHSRRQALHRLNEKLTITYACGCHSPEFGACNGIRIAFPLSNLQKLALSRSNQGRTDANRRGWKKDEPSQHEQSPERQLDSSAAKCGEKVAILA